MVKPTTIFFKTATDQQDKLDFATKGCLTATFCDNIYPICSIP